MEVLDWIVNNWINLSQTAGILGGLLFTGLQLRQTNRIERVRFHFDLAENHANIWKEIFDNPNLVRLLEPDVDLANYPVTEQEAVFVRLLIHHLDCSLEAMNAGLLDRPRGLERDVVEFFRLPVPLEAWSRLRDLQSETVVKFLDTCFKLRP